MAKFVPQFSQKGCSKGEKNTKPSQTRQIGIQSTRQLVETFIKTGKVAQASKEGLYDLSEDATDEDIDKFENPTRDPDFDQFDAMQLATAAVERVLAQRDERERERMETFKKQQEAQKKELEELKARLAAYEKNEDVLNPIVKSDT